MAEDVLEVVDQDLSPVCLQLIGQGTDESGASRARLGCQVRQEHLERPLYTQVEVEMNSCIHNTAYHTDTVSESAIACTTYSEEAVEVWEIKSVCDLSQDIEGQLSLIG